MSSVPADPVPGAAMTAPATPPEGMAAPGAGCALPPGSAPSAVVVARPVPMPSPPVRAAAKAPLARGCLAAFEGVSA